MRPYAKRTPHQGRIAGDSLMVNDISSSPLLRLLRVHRSQEEHNEVILNNSISQFDNHDGDSINSFRAAFNKAVRIANRENPIRYTGLVNNFKSFDRVDFANTSNNDRIVVSLTEDPPVTLMPSPDGLLRFKTALRRTEREFYLTYASSGSVCFMWPPTTFGSHVGLHTENDNVPKELKICESFLGFTAVSDCRAEGLKAEILNTIKEYGIDLTKCRGQGYDGSTFTLTSTRKRDTDGISFVQSALALQLLLIALSTETENDATLQINNLTGFDVSTEDKITCIKYVMSQLPVSSDVLKFRWSSRLVMNPRVELSDRFMTRAAPALGLRVHRLTDHEAEDPRRLTGLLNDMVVEDSNGAMHDTFELEELSGGVHAALLSTIYVRAQWRTAPTLLNGTWPFYDTDGSRTPRPVGMFRVNDVVGYADLDEINAQLSIYY
ncbi:hypothetical protein EVAR_12043_1 [Eumeta japonica]|uniref:Serpin domain-containing protein n=1 Tax=Eumeta variegata TaxID=151549 RepID=A0A4C1U520_EUMVA|nr:hypothetical protein EVAR_12043_1 [Eumeta japonica]